MAFQSETVPVDTLPARTSVTDKDKERAELDALVKSLMKKPIGEAIIIRDEGASGKGLSSRLGRAAGRVGMADITQRGSGTDAKGVYAFIRRIDTQAK